MRVSIDIYEIIDISRCNNFLFIPCVMSTLYLFMLCTDVSTKGKFICFNKVDFPLVHKELVIGLTLKEEII